MWDTNPCFSGRNFIFVIYLLVVDDNIGMERWWDFWWNHMSASPISMWPFYLLFWRSCSAGFQVFFRGSYIICSYRFVVSMGGSKLTIFLCHHLELPPSESFLSQATILCSFSHCPCVWLKWLRTCITEENILRLWGSLW